VFGPSMAVAGSRPRHPSPAWLPGRTAPCRLKGLRDIAAPARNREIVEAGADLCIAHHRTLETSKGTKDCVRQALAAGILVYLIDSEEAIPRRIETGNERTA